MSDKLELKVLFTAVDNFLRPVKAITDASKVATKELKATKDALKSLENQQKLIDTWRATGKAIGITNQDLQKARLRVQQIAEAMKGADGPTAKLQRDFAQASKEARELAGAANRLSERKQRLRQELAAAGIDTRNLANSQRDLKGKIDAATAAVKSQGAALDTQNQKMRRLKAAQAELAKTNELRGKMAGFGTKTLAAGAAVSGAASVPVLAYAKAEDSITQLRMALMKDGGSIAAESKEIEALAERLGNKLPGTTSDFQDMMTMLIRQGMPAKSILGGLGEATAYLAVQLKMAPTAAAEFASKLQDATHTADRDMMGLMDTIQKTFYLGVDQNNMLQGFAKLSPALSILRQEGLGAAKALAPLLVMADQAGMVGESAGNAYRKIFQLALDKKKLAKGNAELAGTGISLDFSDGKGEFGGLEKMYAQLAKLKSVSTQQRLAALKKIFGDDAETLQALTIMIDKGIDGYREVQGKMSSQASLQERVNLQLKTLKNLWDAATGTFTNALVAFGESIAPELHAAAEWLGKVAESTQAWARENPELARGIMLVAKYLGLALLIVGGLTAGIAAVLGPIAMLKFGLSTLGISLGGAGAGAAGGFAARLLGLISPIGKVIAAFTAGFAIGTILNGWMNDALSKLLGYETTLGASLFDLVEWVQAKFGELGAWCSSLVDRIKGFFVGIWDEVKGAWDGGLTGILALILNWNPLGVFYQVMAAVLSWFGVELPGKFTEFGANLMSGLANGILNGIQAVKDTIGGAADTVVGYFKEKLGIHSPSRVFAELGGFSMQGLEQGLAGGEDGPLNAISGLAKKMAGLGAGVVLGGAAMASNIPLDMRPPLSPTAMPGGAPGGNVYQLTFQVPAGVDEARIADLVAKKIEEIEAKRAVRSRSRLADRE